jgi:tRNA A-37 threonylcarbamoyl transferase component Bud32
MHDTGLFTLKKHDKATTAGIMDGRIFGLSDPVWVKRFNSRGLLKCVLKRLFGSRAQRLYRVSRKLVEKGLPVPRPLYYIEPSFKEKNSFYICSVIDDADNLHELFVKGLLKESREILPALARATAGWHLAGAVHGDMKWPNILVKKSEEGYTVFFVDLDQSKMYRVPSVKGMEKDLKRFFRFGIEVGSEGLIDTGFFPEYMQSIPESLRHKIDLQRVREDAYRQWQKKGQKRL